MILHRVVVVALAAVICVWLMRRMSVWSAVGVWAAVMAMMCGVAIVLLRTSSMGQITWKNRIAGYFLPFGYMIGRGRLGVIGLISWGVWVLIAIGVAMLMQRPAPAAVEATTTAPSNTWRTLLFIAWAIDAAGILYLLGVIAKNSSPGSSFGSKLIMPIVILLAVLFGSIGLFYADYTRAAVLLAGGPPAIIGVVFGLFLLVIMVFGRNARWN